MAMRICKNGHKYDDSIYGDNCPCCPPSGPHTVPTFNQVSGNNDIKTQVVGGGAFLEKDADESRTQRIDINPNEGATMIKRIDSLGDSNLKNNDRKLVGVLISYNQNPSGEVYKIFEGRNLLGRDYKCDIRISNDSKISGVHLLILFRDAEGIFWAADQDSSNGTFINDIFAGERTRLNNGDIISIGNSKFVFLIIPEF